MDKTNKIRMMIRLALVDEQFESNEQVLIEELAQMEGISKEELDQILQEELSNKDAQILISQNLDFDSKVGILADLVRVMKADGDVYLSEIKFCEMIAELFGFTQKSIGFLSKRIHGDSAIAPNWELIQSSMRKYVA
ncbi:MAG: hypothetical protein AAF789_09450 [Bacteroidota bacterium]